MDDQQQLSSQIQTLMENGADGDLELDDPDVRRMLEESGLTPQQIEDLEAIKIQSADAPRDDAEDGETQLPDVEVEFEPSGPLTAAEKIMRSLKEIARPSDEAGELELVFASMAMALQQKFPEAVAELEENGELDKLILALARWFAGHTSDNSPRLIVIPVPRRTANGKSLNVFQVMGRVEAALREPEIVGSPF